MCVPAAAGFAGYVWRASCAGCWRPQAKRPAGAKVRGAPSARGVGEAVRIGLSVFAKGVPLPDALVEVEGADGRRSVRAVEVVTGSYTTTQVREKQQARFRLYAIPGIPDCPQASGFRVRWTGKRASPSHGAGGSEESSRRNWRRSRECACNERETAPWAGPPAKPGPAIVTWTSDVEDENERGTIPGSGPGAAWDPVQVSHPAARPPHVSARAVLSRHRIGESRPSRRTSLAR